MACVKAVRQCCRQYARQSKRLIHWRRVQVHSLGAALSARRSPFYSKRCFSAGSGIHPDFQTSYKTGDTDMVKKQVEEDVKNNETFVFIKGTPAMPQCGFSKNLMTILNYLEVDFETRDVLSHPALRQAIKEYSDWPTFPQLYYKGELIGGHDIVVDMFKNGELQELFGIEMESDDDSKNETEDKQ